MSVLDPQLKIAASFAINIAIARFRKKSLSLDGLDLSVCRACLNGLGKIGSADEIYSLHLAGNTGLNSIVGLENGSDFHAIEEQITTDYLYSYSSTTKSVYSTMTAAMALGSLSAGLSYQSFTGFLYKGYDHLNYFLGSGPNGEPFSRAAVEAITGLNYQSVLDTIYEQSEKIIESPAIYFRYYDLSDSFSSKTNLVKAKDSASQEYSVSGELVYSAKPWDGVPFCEYIDVPIYPTNHIAVVGRYFHTIPRVLPCIEKERAINPITGTQFFRRFNDGPYSSGEWSETTIGDVFHNRDKQHLSGSSYSGNTNVLSSFDGIEMNGIEGAGVTVDSALGEFVAPFQREILQQPIGGNIVEQHVGNYNSGRVGYSLSGYGRYPFTNVAHEIYNVVTGHTGFKIVPIQLNINNWSGRLSSIISNPVVPSERMCQTAMNFSKLSMIDLDNSNSGIAGPPQRSTKCDYPYIVVEEDFQSETASRYAGLRLRFGISATEFGYLGNRTTFMGISSGASESFENQNFYQPDEPIQPEVVFGYNIPSTGIIRSEDYSGIIESLCLGMGNGMEKASLSEYGISNNGYIHSGFLFSGGAIPFATVNSSQLGNYLIAKGYSEIPDYVWGNAALDGYGSLSSSGAIIGSPQIEDRMLVGWAHELYGEIPISLLYAYDGTGEYLYSGFDSGLSSSIAGNTVFPFIGPEDGFAKTPHSIGLLSSGWYPVIKTQKRENSFPRYFRGPFATAKKRFLYPAAEQMFGGEIYKSDTEGLDSFENKGNNVFLTKFGKADLIEEYSGKGFPKEIGFPHKVTYNLTIRQYAKREFYKRQAYDAGGGLNTYNYPVNPNSILFDTANSSTPSHAVDENFSQPINQIYSNVFVMADSGSNPFIYDSPPNYIQGFLSDEIGKYSGTNAVVASDFGLRDTGAFIVGHTHIVGYGWYGPDYAATSTKNPVGLFSRYTGYTIPITGSYVMPGYRLETSSFDAESVYSAFSISRNLYEENQSNPERGYGYAGSDPLYLKRVGNFSGITDNYSADEQLNGSRHPTGPSGLVGDSWMGFYSGDKTVDSIRYGYGHYHWDSMFSAGHKREPAKDNRIIIADMKPTGFGFHFAALEYFPGGYSGKKTASSFLDETGYFRSGFARETSGPFNYENQIFSYTGTMETGILYKIPSGSDWGTGVSVTGWQATHTGEIYYWRQQCKIEVIVSNINWSGYGNPPYDVEDLVMPTGNCLITGVLKYENIKERPVLSEGLFLKDISVGDVVKENSLYPQFLSNTMIEHGYQVSIPANCELQYAPSRQLEVTGENVKYLTDESFAEVNTNEKNYNKYIVGAISDYAYLNAKVMPSYDGVTLPDGKMLPETTMLYSACQGQSLADNTVNPIISKLYEVSAQKQYYDAEFTAASGDSRFSESVIPVWRYPQPNVGTLIPKGITWTEYNKGLY